MANTKAFLFIFWFFTLSVLAQQKTLRFIDVETGIPVGGADIYADSQFVASTNYNGNISMDSKLKFKTLISNHILYENCQIPYDSLATRQVYKLFKRDNVLEEIVVSKGQDDTLTNVRAHFNWTDRAATYVPFTKDGYITKLRFRVTSEHGVKGLNYLPFKANVYEYDTVTKLPGKNLLDEDIIVENKNGDDWAEADISKYKIKMAHNGVCIGFIIPEREFYKVDLIRARHGAISAVPNLKKVSAGKNDRSYVFDYFPEGNGYVRKWRRVKDKFYKMEIVVEE